MRLWRFSFLYAICLIIVAYIVGIFIALLFPPDVLLQAVPLITILVPTMAVVSEYLMRWSLKAGAARQRPGYGRLFLHSALTPLVSLACLAGLILMGYTTPREALVLAVPIIVLVCAGFAKLVFKPQ